MDGLTCDEFIEAKIQEKIDLLDRALFPLESAHNDMLKEFEKYTKTLLRARKTDNYGPLARYTETPRFKDILAPSDENSCPNVTKENKINNTNNRMALETMRIKTEKLSISSQPVCDDTESMPAPKMPPPKTKRVKKEKISNVGKVQQEPISEIDNSTASKRVTRSKTDRASDVILQNPVIPVVDLVESFDGEEEVPIRSTRTRTIKKTETAPTRSTRTRTKKAQESKEDEEVKEPPARTTRTKTRTKRDRSESESESGDIERKKSKSASPKANEQLTDDLSCKDAQNDPMTNISTHTEYEDAVSQLENKPNETFVVSANKTPKPEEAKTNLPRMNETVVLDKSKAQQTTVNNPDDMITDDESMEEQVVTTPQKKAKQENLKHVFSPYENSPVKKKVEAFEKFQKNENKTTSKMNSSKILREIEENRGNVKEKAKGFIGSCSTPIHKTNPPSASKIGKYFGHKSSVLNSSRGANTSTGQDFKERELKRLEREKDQKKRDMLKQAMSEDRKKKHDEKMLRIQQLQKQTKEKEMEKALESQRIKEERVKMLLQQKEEKQRLLKEENERKRLLAKQRAEENRRQEEALKLAMQEKKEQRRKMEADSSKNKSEEPLPIYLAQPTPPLPCNDCYDSDDERHAAKKQQIPGWASKSRIKAHDYIQTTIGHRIKNTMFCCQSQNIDLRDVFKRIDARKLKRTSSANWDKPPRFTLLPPLQDD